MTCVGTVSAAAVSRHVPRPRSATLVCSTAQRLAWRADSAFSSMSCSMPVRVAGAHRLLARIGEGLLLARRTISRSRSVGWMAGSTSTSRLRPRRVARRGRRSAAAPPSECATTRSHAPPLSGHGRGEIGGVGVDRVVQRARSDAVTAQVDGIRAPAGVREGDAVAPHQRAVGAEPVDEQRAARCGGIAPREAGECDGCGHATAYERPGAAASGE